MSTEAIPVRIILPPVDPITTVFDRDLRMAGDMDEGGRSPASMTKAGSHY